MYKMSHNKAICGSCEKELFIYIISWYVDVHQERLSPQE